MTPVVLVSVGLQLALLIVQFRAPTAQPKKFQERFALVGTATAIVCTPAGIPLYPAALPVGPLAVAAALVAIAIAPPVVGLLESKYRNDGQAVYSTGTMPGTSNRFPGHLLTNILAALAAAGLIWVAHSTDGFNSFTPRFSNDASFNVMLPLVMIAVFAFVRWQQIDACPDLAERVKRNEDWEGCITGFSLRHWHQLTNLLYLIIVTFTATTTTLYLLAYAMEQAKAGQPLGVSWQIVLAIVASLSFLYACGGPWSREHRAVYLTFLTGTPAALGAAVIWLSWLREGAARNAVAMSIVGIGYVLYCVEAVLGSRSRGEKLELAYFSAAVIAVVLVLLIGALYLS